LFLGGGKIKIKNLDFSKTLFQCSSLSNNSLFFSPDKLLAHTYKAHEKGKKNSYFTHKIRMHSFAVIATKSSQKSIAVQFQSLRNVVD